MTDDTARRADDFIRNRGRGSTEPERTEQPQESEQLDALLDRERELQREAISDELELERLNAEREALLSRDRQPRGASMDGGVRGAPASQAAPSPDAILRAARDRRNSELWNHARNYDD